MERIGKRELAHALGNIRRLIRRPTLLTNNGVPELLLLPLKKFPDRSDLWTEKRDMKGSEDLSARRERKKGAVTVVLMDTCALAKFYALERESEAVREFVLEQEVIVVSSLMRTEICTVFAKKRAAKKITPRQEAEKLGAFLGDLNGGRFAEMEVTPGILTDAGMLVSRFVEERLFTLDAIHLATARMAGVESVATSDRDLGAVARKLGFAVSWFGPGEPGGL